MNKWCVSVGAAFLLSFVLLLAVGAAQGQSVNVSWSPTNPVAYEPITFYIQPSFTSVTYVYIIPPGMSCEGGLGGSCGGPVLTLNPGQSSVTLQGGLEAGTYGLLIETNYAGGVSYYHSSLKVYPSKPVPEFSGTIVVFSLSFAVLYCILEKRRRHPALEI